MYQWLRNNNKRLLAFFGVFLMIAFLLPTTYQGCDPGDLQLGTLPGERKVFAREVQNAYNEFEYLRQNVLLPSGRPGAEGFEPLMARLDVGMAIDEFDENKTLYYLLRDEAIRLGTEPSPSQLDQVMEAVALRLRDGRVVSYESIRDTFDARMARGAVNHLLAVQNAFRRAVANLKVTEPQRLAETAMQLQSIRLGLVPFSADDYAAKVPAPTPEQLSAQFKAFADRLPGNPTRENPFGFGYRLPDRVKLQFISVPREQVRAAVLAQKSDYDWEVEARRFYMANPGLFVAATTQPSTQPAATQPAPRPFEEVRAEALERVLAPQVERLQRLVQQRVTSALNTDYAAFARAAGTGGPTTAPAGAKLSSVGPAYNTFEYLQALSADLQKQFGVVATVVNLGDASRSVAELRARPDLGMATATVGGQMTDLPAYAVLHAETIVPAADREKPGTLSLFEPSQTLTDIAGSFYVFRLIAVDPSHVPTSLDEVRAAVEADVRRKAEFDLAVADANALLKAAGEVGLASAAQSAGRKLHDTGRIRFGRPLELPEFPPLSPFGERRFTQQAFDLLAAPAGATTRPSLADPVDPANPPRSVIELPSDRRVLVAELAEVSADLPAELMTAMETDLIRQLTGQQAQMLAAQWFSYKGTAERVGFTDPFAAEPSPAETQSPATAPASR